MRSWPVVIALLAGCYSPSVHEGAPCGPGGECPSGQACRADGRCYSDGASDDADTGSNDADPGSSDAAVDASPPPVWGNVTQLTELDTVTGKSDPTLGFNGLVIGFVGNPTGNDEDLYGAIRASTSDPFSSVALSPGLNATDADDRSPELTGSDTVWFTSDRNGKFDVFTATFSGTSWTTPTVVVELSSAGDDTEVGVSPDGLTAIVTHAGGAPRFFIHTRASTSAVFGAGIVHNELNTVNNIGAPHISNGGEVIYFHGGTTRDLYVSTLKGNGDYTMPKPITELDTGAREAAPWVDEAETFMLFERDGAILRATR